MSEGRAICPVPYVDYSFEYPPLIGLLWYFTTCFSITVTPRGEVSLHSFDYYIHCIAELHFIANAFFLLLFLLFSVFSLYKLLNALGGELSLLNVFLWLILPSTLLFTVYNWDIICVALALGSLAALRERKYFISGALLGASIATKLMTASIAYALFLHFLLKQREDVRPHDLSSFLAGLSILGITPYAALLTISPRGFFDFIAHHSAWYCENCLYLLFVHDILSQLHKALAIASVSSLALAIALLMLTKKRVRDSLWLYKLLTLSILGAVLFNYVFSPQMVLLFSPLVMVFLSRTSKVVYAASDVANFLIMFFFFYDRELRYLLSRLGLPVDVRFSPWTIDSPVQWFAAVRNILLLAILTIELVRLYRS